MDKGGPVVADSSGVSPPAAISRREARALLGQAFTLLHEGTSQLAAGQELLAHASSKAAWRALGFTDWDQCLLDYAARHKPDELSTQGRKSVAIALMNYGRMSRRAIARALGVSSSSIIKDLLAAAESGQITAQAQQERAAMPSNRVSITGGSRRRDLLKSWRTAVHELNRKARALQDMGMDNRYGDRLEDLRTSSRADLQQVSDIILAILKDFDRHDGNHHEES